MSGSCLSTQIFPASPCPTLWARLPLKGLYLLSFPHPSPLTPRPFFGECLLALVEPPRYWQAQTISNGLKSRSALIQTAIHSTPTRQRTHTVPLVNRALARFQRLDWRIPQRAVF